MTPTSTETQLNPQLADLPHNFGTHRYSIRTALRSISECRSKPFHPKGLEGEVSQELTRRMGRQPQGFWMPLDVPVEPERRADTTLTGSGAAQTVWPTAMFLDVLRAKLVIQALGGRITTLANEGGQVQLPVQTAATPVTWVAEGAQAGSFTGLTVGSVTFIPHTLLANTGISRFMKDTQAPGFDAWIYEDLAKSIAVNVDAAGINGSGLANNQPLGLMQTPGVPTYTLSADTGNGGAPAYNDIVGMEAVVANANGDSRADARLGWLTSPNGRSKMRRVDAATGNAGRWLWSQDADTVLGKPALATTNVPSNATKGSGTSLTSLIYGDFANLLVNLFTAVDIVFNPFTITTSGYYQIYAYQDADVQVARPAGFVVANGMITT
jgi:HK97 family phage major capsid protein